MIFPGFPGVLSFFQVFQVEWEHWLLWKELKLQPQRSGARSANLYNFQRKLPRSHSDDIQAKRAYFWLGLLMLTNAFSHFRACKPVIS